MQAIRFDTPKAINLSINGANVAERIDAVKQYMAFLDNQSAPSYDIDFLAGFEESRVSVRIKWGVNVWWKIDFHLIWPNPRLNNQHFNQLKLAGWTAARETGDPDEIQAEKMRKRAADRLIKLTQQFAQANENRVCMVSPTD